MHHYQLPEKFIKEKKNSIFKDVPKAMHSFSVDWSITFQSLFGSSSSAAPSYSVVLSSDVATSIFDSTIKPLTYTG